MQRSKTPAEKCSAVTATILVILAIVSAIVAIIGTVGYVSEKRAESTYKGTMCFIKNYTVINKNCSSETCSGYAIFRTCTKKNTPCNTASYTVKYNTTNGTTIESTVNGSAGPGPNSFNQTRTCYYDNTNQKLIRWEWPKPRTYLIVLCVGWAAFGLFTILGTGLCIWICCYGKRSSQYNQLS